jgi:hypothetical protein
MAIIQAFFNLSEILVGSSYAKQEYEDAIAFAFSLLAFLQEMNDQNVPNPISFFVCRKRFFGKKLMPDLIEKAADPTFGQKFSDYVTMLDANMKRIESVCSGLAELALGGAPVGIGQHPPRIRQARGSQDQLPLRRRIRRDHAVRGDNACVRAMRC